jgi:hypothetical protein
MEKNKFSVGRDLLFELKKIMYLGTGSFLGAVVAWILMPHGPVVKATGSFLYFLAYFHMSNRSSFQDSRKMIEGWNYASLHFKGSETSREAGRARFIAGHACFIASATLIAYAFVTMQIPLMLIAFLGYLLGDDYLLNGKAAALTFARLDRMDAERQRKDSETRKVLASVTQAQKEADPVKRLTVGAHTIHETVLQHFKSLGKVHVPTCLCALGALAGYACQASVRARNIASSKPSTTGLVTVTGTDRRSYYFGDALNKPLAENSLSVWSLMSVAAQASGSVALPDAAAIIKRCAGAVGRDDYGVFDVEDDIGPIGTPIFHVKRLWPLTHPIANKVCKEPEEWPIVFALAARDAQIVTKDIMPPDQALSLLMESAVLASKIDLATF